MIIDSPILKYFRATRKINIGIKAKHTQGTMSNKTFGSGRLKINCSLDGNQVTKRLESTKPPLNKKAPLFSMILRYCVYSKALSDVMGIGELERIENVTK